MQVYVTNNEAYEPSRFKRGVQGIVHEEIKDTTLLDFFFIILQMKHDIFPVPNIVALTFHDCYSNV